MKTYPALFYGIVVEQSDPEVVLSKGVSCLVSHILHSAWFVWCLVRFRSWYVLYVQVLGWEGMACKHNLHSGWHIQWVCHQDPRVGTMGACAIHPTHPFCMGFTHLFSHYSCIPVWKRCRDRALYNYLHFYVIPTLFAHLLDCFPYILFNIF